MYTCIDCLYILVAWITISVTWIFLYSCYMTFSCYWYWYDRHECCWYAMWETKCHVDLSHGATSKISYLLFLVSRYLLSRYQQNSCPIIVLHVLCTVLIPDTLHSLKIKNITWRWGKFNAWLGIVRWMS